MTSGHWDMERSKASNISESCRCKVTREKAMISSPIVVGSMIATYFDMTPDCSRCFIRLRHGLGDSPTLSESSWFVSRPSFCKVDSIFRSI